MKVNRAFKSYSFFVTNKDGRTADNLCMKFSSKPMQACRVTSVHLSLLLPLFARIFEPQGQDQQNGKRILCRLLPLSFKIDLKDTSFHISINSLGLYLSPKSLSNFLSNLYIPPWLGTIFKFMVFRFLENAFPSQKTESRHFYSCNLSQNSPSGSHHHPQAEGNYSSPQAVVFGKSTFPFNRKAGGL